MKDEAGGRIIEEIHWIEGETCTVTESLKERKRRNAKE